MKIRNLIFLIAGIAVLTSIVTIMHPYAESASTPLETLEGTYASIPVNLSIGQNVSALNIPLSRLAVVNQGAGSLPYESRPIMVVDNNMTLALYNGTTANGTLVAAVATNVGSSDITIGQMGIVGAIKSKGAYDFVIQKNVVGGCTHAEEPLEITHVFPNGTRTTQYLNATVKCVNPASHGPIILKPGESFTTYIVGDMKKGSVPINEFKASAAYLIGNSPYYSISVPFETVN